MEIIWILVITGIIAVPIGLFMIGSQIANHEWGHAFTSMVGLALFVVLLSCFGNAVWQQIHGYPDDAGKTVSTETKFSHKGEVGQS